MEVIGRDGAGAKITVCEFHVGDCVGELEFIHNHKTVADVRAKGAVRSAKLNRAHFEMCMGPIVDILKRNAGTDNRTYDYYNALELSDAPQRPSSHVRLDDLQDNPQERGSVDTGGFSFGTNPIDRHSVDTGGFSFGANPVDRHTVDGGFRIGDPRPSSPFSTSTHHVHMQSPDFSGEDDILRQLRFKKGARRRQSLMTESIDESEAKAFSPASVPKGIDDAQKLQEVLERNYLFKHLDDREIRVAVDAMFRCEMAAGEILQEEGELTAEAGKHLHVIMEGTCCVTREGASVRTLGALDIVGELELLYSQPAACTIRAASAMCTWALPPPLPYP